MDSKDALVVFEGAKIRRIWHEDQWYFSVVDIIQVLTDSGSPRQYWGVLKSRETQLLTICLQLKLPSSDGKYYNTDCVKTENAFRHIQNILSKKAKPFKRWLAKEGFELCDKIVQLKMPSADGKKYETDCTKKESMFRIIQSIPAPEGE